MKRREFIAGLGGAVAWPLVAWAQQGDRVGRIGVLLPYDEDPVSKTQFSAFTQALAGLGWTDVRNVRMELRYGGEKPARAQELVGLQPDIILTNTTPVTVAIQRETRTIPIVFVNVSDPVVSGIVASLNRAGTSPVSPTSKLRWEASGLSCSRRSLPGSSGPPSGQS